jgi:hypothetical protein
MNTGRAGEAGAGRMDNNEAVVPPTTELSDDEIEAAEDRMNGHICPECGATDWLAEERGGDYIRIRCDDCCSYGVLIRMPEV